MTKPSAVSHTPAMSVEPDSYGFCLFDNAETLVARVFSYGDDKAPNTAEAKANADLFAAAPDLLALVRRIAAQDEFTGATPNDLPMWQAYALLNAWRLEAIALLAKAEGR